MTIFAFTHNNDFLSNFYPAEFFWDGMHWPNSKCAYQAAKSLDIDVRKSFTTMSARESKKAGKTVVMREDWEDVKVSIMTEIVYEKFSQNPHLMKRLLETGTQKLEEGNSWGDTFWGVCPVGGYGKNMLGKVLMTIRKSQQEIESGVV